MPASSQASSELSTASFTAVRRAFLGLSKPSRCLFFAKNSLTDMSRCFAAMDSAVAALRFGCSPVLLTFAILTPKRGEKSLVHSQPGSECNRLLTDSYPPKTVVRAALLPIAPRQPHKPH